MNKRKLEDLWIFIGTVIAIVGIGLYFIIEGNEKTILYTILILLTLLTLIVSIYVPLCIIKYFKKKEEREKEIIKLLKEQEKDRK